ncbi:hypothetical protein ABPG77_010645 [Micractinium sp. CCAP 211/92]
MSAQQPSAAGPGGSAAGGCDEATVLLGLNQAPSMNSVLRALKREESSLFSCVASIADDAQFVEQVSARYPGLPLLPNLRCGVWYVSPPLGATCYFKSTDGHNNNWSFSTVRLNLSTAEAAAAAGGCVIVDATRRGKRFPDAMSKTIPMWCAVLNRAVHRLRQQAAAPAAAPHAAAAVAAGAVPGAAPWDCKLHLPPWVSDVERNSIQQRLDGWVDDLFGVKPDLSVLVATLAKPLRCLWVSQDSHLWAEQGQAVDVASLPFTPVVLVNASASATRERRCLTLPAEAPGEEPLSISYSYCPGAADDEESWACGLSPELMWRHLRALLAAGPGGIEAASAAVQQLGSGIFLLGGTGLALSSAAAAAAPAVWQHVDAVLHSAACRFCWLRVRGSKDERHSLQQHLPAVLAFARAQLAARRRLLLCCDSGLDASVCAAVACLLAFYSLEERPGAGFGLLPVWAGPPQPSSSAPFAGSLAMLQAGGHSGEGGTCAAAGSEQPSHSEPLPRFPPVAAGFDKLAVRQHLGVVSAHYPAGRPTRGMLKQVYNFFLGQM